MTLRAAAPAWLLLVLTACWLPVHLAHSQPVTSAGPRAHTEPRLALVIDDVGHSTAQLRRVLAVPGPITLAVLPFTAAAEDAARLAAGHGSEIILHQPMQSLSGYPMGPGGLSTSMARDAFMARLDASLAAVPHSLGVSNHTGSLLTQSTQRMDWLMQALAQRNLFFLDSRTTPHTVAVRQARQRGVPVIQRDVFLDHDPSRAAVEHEFARAIGIARQRGQAVVIGHPHATTLAVLADRLPQLPTLGIRQVRLSTLLAKPPSATMASVSAGAD